MIDEPEKPKTTEGLSQEALLVDFVDTAGVGLHWVGADGTILWANPADYEPLGYRADDYIGHNITEFHVDDDVIADILRRLAAGERLRDREARLRCSDGSIRSVLINSSVLFDDAGRFVHTRCFTLDITDRKRIEEAKEQFVSILGHDLRNPLSAITAAAQFMLVAGDLSEAHARAATRIARSANRMSRLIADLLDFTRARMGQGIPIAPIPADMADICRHAIEELLLSNPDRNIAVDVTGDAHGDWDPDRVAQVISNLAGNAVEHGRDPIRVTLQGEADEVVLEVCSAGSPIPPEMLAVIFDPFSRPDSRASARTGLGLGLYISHAIVRSHGGAIAVRSTAADGTTFTVRWPRRADAALRDAR
jgi:PAS domain S-box-containing protein